MEKNRIKKNENVNLKKQGKKRQKNMGLLSALKPIFRLLPEVAAPETQPPVMSRLKWTFAVLVLFFVMGSIPLIGIDIGRSAGGQLQLLQHILASNIGTLLSVGIGPIVLASIILQLLVGGKIIELDLSDPKQKADFMSTQKLLALIFCFFEAAAFVFGGLLVPAAGWSPWVIILQVALGSIALMYLDEVVSKYGIGSGISLFIAGGVAGQVFWEIFNPLDINYQFNLGAASGKLFLFFAQLQTGFVQAFIANLLPILISVIIFLVVVFAEGMHVNIPITMGRGGIGGRFPVKLLYVSNLPVILTVALFANIRILSLATAKIPVIGGLMGSLNTILTAPTGLLLTVFAQLASSGLGAAGFLLPQLVQALLYLIIFTAFCVLFGMLWVPMAGQDASAIASQLQRSGMFIPGFRRDPRVVQQVLERYIPTITILGSVFVGLLAGLADLTGALGTGTGILLTVGSVYKLCEELAKHQLMETHPLLKRFFA